MIIDSGSLIYLCVNIFTLLTFQISSNDFFGTHGAAVIKVDSLSNMENAWSVSDTDIKLELENAYQSSRTPASPAQDCNCRGCINRREIADLVDRFENVFVCFLLQNYINYIFFMLELLL